MDAKQLQSESKKEAYQSVLDRLVSDLLRDAKNQKRRVRHWLHTLRGDEIRTPSRGPIQQNGMRCIRWHYWQAATAKHRSITDQIKAVKSCIPYAIAQIPLLNNQPNNNNDNEL